MARDEYRIGGERPFDVQSLRPRLCNRGRDDALFLIAQHAALAGVRIQPAYGDAWLRQTPETPQIVRHDLQHARQAVDGQRIADRAQRQVSGGERDTQAAPPSAS